MQIGRYILQSNTNQRKAVWILDTARQNKQCDKWYMDGNYKEIFKAEKTI